MRKILHLLLHLTIFGLLTLMTQIGGLVYLLMYPLRSWFRKRFDAKGKRIMAKITGFSVLYLLITFGILPPIAQQFGRVPLPLTGQVKPLNYFTAIFNRHYVRPKLKEVLLDAAQAMEKKHPGSIIAYMDANFPFIHGYPMVPHLSHSDGKKVDLAFFYKDPQTNRPFHRKARNFMGYGGSDGPQGQEENWPAICKQRGHWQYNLMDSFMPSTSQEKMQFDKTRMRDLVRILVRDPRTGKILIEPHLKQRLGLTYGKIRFHGCHAVRHDDHLHLQL